MRRPALLGVRIALAVLGLFVRAVPTLAAPAATPLGLQDAIATALARSPAYLQSAAGVAGSEARLRQAQASRGLTVSAQDNAQYVDPVAQLSTPFGTLPFSPSSVSNTPLVSGTLSLYDGGVSAARIAQAAAAVAQARAQVADARERTATAVAKAYYQLAAAFAQVGISEAAVRIAAAHVRQAQEFLRAGTSPRADVLRAQTELANERVHELDARNAVAVAQARLDAAMGVAQTTEHQPSDSLEAPAAPMDLATLLQQTKTLRGDLAAARYAVSAAASAVTAAQGAHRPRVSLTATDGNVQPAIEAGFHNQFTVAVNAVWRLVDGGYDAARIAEARAGVEQARLAVEELSNNIELQVRTAFLNLSSSRERVAAARTLVTSADENLRLAQLRTRGGVATSLELQDAELRDRGAHQSVIDSEIALHTAVIDVQAAAGIAPGSVLLTPRGPEK